MKVRVLVRLKPDVLDVQGKAVQGGLQGLGFNEIDGVRVGRMIEMDVPGSSLEEAKEQVQQMCSKLLVNPIIEDFELGRAISPYGAYMNPNDTNGYDENWKHRYTFDVTDFQHLLKDSVEIDAFYSGWSSGFSVTLNFEFIGVPKV